MGLTIYVEKRRHELCFKKLSKVADAATRLEPFLWVVCVVPDRSAAGDVS
jgi:hypothetical protein